MTYSILFSILCLVIKPLTSIFALHKDRGMKKKRYIAYFLFFISMMMLVVPVIPHHHHADGLICMKNDITTSCCEHRHSPANEHCCCDTGCVTTHFVQQTPSSDNDAWAHPIAPWVVTLFIESISKWQVLPENEVKRHDVIYLESLHGTFITRATGLRAPPSADNMSPETSFHAA